MINKLLCVIGIIFGVYAFYGCFFNGALALPWGDRDPVLKVSSYEQLQKKSLELDSNLAELNRLNSTGMDSATRSLESEIDNYKSKKQAYDDLAASASREEIAEANKEEKYLLDYLWIRVGNYASDNNVKFKMEPDYEKDTLTFDITGSYISVINFIYDLQNDVELNFRIDGVAIEGGISSQAKAHFMVENITVITSPSEA